MQTKNYEVHLEIFEGPLDLLLFLIKKNDLDIYDIPLSEITKEYLAYLDIMKDLNLDLAGDFLVMASTLMQIKAKMLLPSHEAEGEEGPDPRAELVNKLLEYQKFKEAAKFLEKRADEFKDVFYRNSPVFAEDEKHLTIDIFKLMATLKEILDNTTDGQYVVKGEEFPIEKKMEKIMQLLEGRAYISFKDIFKGETRRLAILTCFLAMLELIKLQKVFARQENHFAEILVYKKDPAAAPPTPSAEPLGPAPAGASAPASEPTAAARGPIWPTDDAREKAPEAVEPAYAEAMPSGTPEPEQDQEQDQEEAQAPEMTQDAPPGADEVIDAVPLTPHQDN